MTEHILKTWPVYWYAVERGDKNFEVRRDDRGFQKGDAVVLRRTLDDSSYSFDIKSTGSERNGWQVEYYDLRFRIMYVLTGGQFGVKPGYVVLALGPEEVKDED